ncbi:MAG TPA: AMP-binding protein, partial [Thermoanaerobaculia bacterium]|nr:AMP-binding protein [Thermoanaerobaculia bacterium]
MAAHKPVEDVQTLAEILCRRAKEAPDHRAYLYLAGDGEETASLTYRELDLRARALAAWLQGRGLARERVLLLYPQGLEFVAAFLGCLYAGTVAVPAYPPGSDRSLPRLGNIVRDCRPALALTVSSSAGRLRTAAGRLPEIVGLPWAASDEIPLEMAGEWVSPAVAGDAVAFLQYTSGSTSTPRGVRVLHSNLLHNEEMIRRAFGQSEESVIVSWLPLYHDMGLIGGVLQPLFVGAQCVLMSPVSFLQRPARWLEAVSRYRATTSGGPDFAYDLCARKIGPAERERLDLSSWAVAFNGSEPVRAATIERFSLAFVSQGFRREAFFPCYGLAEATLFVTGGTVGGAGPRVAGEKSLVSSGRVWTEMRQRVVVVDPESAEPLPSGRVGEIWVSGPSVTNGYWERPEESERTFAARLNSGEGPFLRTGDLGFLDGEGELFVTGRLKDLIILRGRNHYPQDIERTVEESHPAVRPGAVAAFSVEAGDGDSEERLVIALELEDRRAGSDLVAAVAEAARRAVAEMHEARVWEVVALRPGGLPRTSSGKLQRHACRAAYQSGRWESGVLGRSSALEDAAVEGGALLSREELLALPDEERTSCLAAEVLARAARALRSPGLRLAAGEPLTGAGLDSLAAVELQHGLEEDFGAAPSLGTVLGGASAEQIAAEVLARLEGGAAGEKAAEIAGAEDEVPLSYGQRALWFLEKLNPGTTAFVLAGAAEVEGEVDEAALGRSLDRVVARHGALRMAFREVGGQVVQRIEPAPLLTSPLSQP